jgi:hypothetical protein
MEHSTELANSTFQFEHGRSIGSDLLKRVEDTLLLQLNA